MSEHKPNPDGLRAGPSATTEEIAEVERALRTLLPDGLVILYRSANGQYSNLGEWWVVWPLRLMLEADS